MNWEPSTIKPLPPATTGGGRPPKEPVNVWTFPPPLADAAFEADEDAWEDEAAWVAEAAEVPPNVITKEQKG